MGAGGLRIEVSDEGAGFDPGRMPPPEERGGGFGLFSIRERIGLVGGVLEIESSPGKGSRFTLIAPARKKPAAPGYVVQKPPDAVRGEGETAPDSRSGIKVLIVDDHTLFRDGMDRMLKKQLTTLPLQKRYQPIFRCCSKGRRLAS